jgi:hypothetical protein
VRDDTALGPDEDLDREPDGVPHDVVGYTALCTTLVAMLLVFALLSRVVALQVAAIATVIAAVPIIVVTARRRADRERDRAHPSR